MRYESSVTSISWIPSEAVEGMIKLPFEVGINRYDDPPPDRIDDAGELCRSDRARFANELRAWIEVEDGRVTGHGYTGHGHIANTKVRLGRAVTFTAVAFPDRQHEPEVGPGWVRFVQTAGGRTGLPSPRRVSHPPYVQIAAPLAWTTLSLTIHTDGASSHDVVGASAFPRHWIYDAQGRLTHKSGTIDFREWWLNAFGAHTPWGDEDSPALVTQVETALERELSAHIMRVGARPRIRTLGEGDTLVRQGDTGTELFLLLDGVLSVDVDGAPLAQVGPGAVLGERALLEGGARTATLRALTRCRVAAVDGGEIEPDLLQTLAGGHRREET